MVFDFEDQEFIDKYDLHDYHVWNSDCAEIKRIRRRLRDYLLQLSDFQCCYCRQRKLERHGMTWDIEHVAPKSLYPQFLFNLKNLAILCKECNIAKGDKDTLLGGGKAYPNSGVGFSIIHPHYDDYDAHIEIARIGSQTTYRVKNGHKGKNTYIMCNLVRFDYAYAEWDSFDDALTKSLMESIELLGADATAEDVKRALPLAVRLAVRKIY